MQISPRISWRYQYFIGISETACQKPKITFATIERIFDVQVKNVDSALKQSITWKTYWTMIPGNANVRHQCHSLIEANDLSNGPIILRFSNVVQRFVPEFTQMVALLNKNLQEDQPITFRHLNSKDVRFMNESKGAFILLPVFTLLNGTAHNSLDKDTCAVLVRFVLL